ncbi:hypothetical protein Purlil1_2187 [Purpureocillium lilacinum]|uniref:LITAF domain-containing protein n=1 Tax=Purpureocillium lilacinum TaxID=33203 RepID=A0ABR0CBR4_PURLI|nr:hypothetical protein Purlil1_2187 [Purpureocillium lilacinum]
MAGNVPLQELRRRRRVVTCPACRQTALTVRIREPYRKVDMFMMIYLGILLFPIYEHFRGPGGAWVTHYCSRCGLRLVGYLSGPRGHYIHAKEATLQPLPSSNHNTTDMRQHREPKSERSGVRYCPSPLGPPGPVDKSLIANHTHRYQHLRSSTTLHVDPDSTDGIPSAVWNAARTQKLHRIDRLNAFEPNGAFHARFLWPGKFDASELIPRRWAFANSCLSVVDARTSRCVGAGQLAQQSWDTVIYLPQQDSNNPTSPAPTPPLLQYDCKVGQDRQVFSRQCPQFFVPGPQGSSSSLLWTVRRIITADDVEDGRPGCAKTAPRKPTARLVLLDGYDRLIAANDGAWTTRKSSGAGSGTRHDVLRMYAPTDDEALVDAVVTSYAVLCAQLVRRMQWNDILKDED